MPILQQSGFDFCFDTEACTSCRGFCCRGVPGHVWIGEQDVRSIGAFLNVNSVDFIGRFTDRINNRLSLQERYIDGNYTCIFFDTRRKKCSIYEVRPDQCRRFPFWQYFRVHREELASECPGIRECMPKE
jgi:Fe-S-cluster containining protein